MERVNDLSELTPNMQFKVIDFLKECYDCGLDIYPFETYRSQERQNELYAQGRTAPGAKVTWTKNSRHTKREAVDLAFGGPGKWHWNGDWDKMIEIAKKYGLESLAPKEKAHLQDDGTEYNKITMNNAYEQIMNNEVKKENQIFTDHSGEGTLSHAEIKALLEIGLERKVKQLVEKLSKL